MAVLRGLASSDAGNAADDLEVMAEQSSAPQTNKGKRLI